MKPKRVPEQGTRFFKNQSWQQGGENIDELVFPGKSRLFLP